MKNSLLSLFTIFLLTFSSSCEKPQNNSNSCSDCCSTFTLSTPSFNGKPTDNFDILKAKIQGDCLEVTVSVGGGCGDRNFDLLAEDVILESYPTKRKIRVVLDDQDFCEALLTETISFDLSSLRTDSKGTDILLLEGYNTALTYKY